MRVLKDREKDNPEVHTKVYRRGELMSWELLKPEEDGV